MFTWICPKCGSEVPPAYNECPNCAARAAAPAPAVEQEPVAPAPPAPRTEPAAAPPPPPPPVTPPPRTTAPPVPASWTSAAPAVPSQRKAFPAWLASLLTAAGMLAVIAIVYWGFRPSRAAETPAATPDAAPATFAANPGSPFAKHLELAGFRITEDQNQRVQVRFLVVNHSGAELPPFKGSISLNTGRAGNTIDLPFVLPSLGPYESREVTSTTKTEVRAYELPDWQFIKPEFTVTEQEPAQRPR